MKKTIMNTPLIRLSRNQRRSAAVFMLVCFLPTGVLALPAAPQVVGGTAAINVSGSAMTVTSSANAIINWRSFSIGQGESTRFIQPTATSTVLNRITGGDPSSILGTLQSNGRILLINPNGVLFGANARVEVNGLTASTLDISNQDFLAGRMKFSAGPVAGGIENRGTITVPAGGSVYLIAPNVTNSGVITAPNGDVLLAAGREVLLVDKNSPEIAIVVSAPEHQALNLGTLVADAGRIGMYGGIVHQKGLISADSAVRDSGGRIFLKSTRETTIEAGSRTTANGANGGSVTVQASEGTTLVSGEIEARGTAGRGGDVRLLGERVGLVDKGALDATGATGGGTVLAGGDYQGSNRLVQNAEATYMGKDTTIKADAVDAGSGGKIIVWADDTTRAYGSISARGGKNGGDGGFVEVSGKQDLAFGARVDTSSRSGSNGTLLLDPLNIYISNKAAGVGGDDAKLIAGSTVFATDPSASYDIAAGTLEALSAATNIDLQASNAITIAPLTAAMKGGADAELTLSQTGFVNFRAGAGGFSMAAGDKINMTGGGTLTIDMLGGSSGGTGDGALGRVNINSGGPVILKGTTVDLGALNLTGSTATLAVTAKNGISQSGVLNIGGLTQLIADTNVVNVDIWGAGVASSKFDGPVSTGSVNGGSVGDFLLSGQGGILDLGSMTATGSNIQIGAKSLTQSGSIHLSYPSLTSFDPAGSIALNDVTNTFSGGFTAETQNRDASIKWNEAATTKSLDFTAGTQTLTVPDTSKGVGFVNRSGSINIGTTNLSGVLALFVDGASNNITVGGNVSAGAANFYVWGNGDISGAGVISAGSLNINNAGGNVSLTGLNNVGSIAATLAGANKTFTYEGASGFTVGGTGITTNNGDITMRGNAAAGTVLVNADVSSGSGNVLIGQAYGGAGTASIAVANGKTVSGNAVQLYAAPGSGNVNVDGTVTGNSVTLEASGGVHTGPSGLIKSNAINLEISGPYTGSIGSAGSSLLTSPLTPVTGTTTFTIGQSAAGAPSAVNIFHDGIANISTVNLGTNAPFAFQSTGDLNVNSTVTTGAGAIKLIAGAGSGLNVGSSFSLLGNMVDLKADRIDIGPAAAVGTAVSTVTLLPFSNSRPISLGPSADPAGSMELSTYELSKINALLLNVGDGLSGPLTVDAAISPAGVATLALRSGGTVGQSGAGTIIFPGSLAVQAMGGIYLPSGNGAGAVTLTNNGSGNVVYNSSLGASNTLQLAANNSGSGGYVKINEVTGSINIAAPSGAPGFLSLKTPSGTITQNPGALLGFTSLNAEGTSVTLTEDNPVGVISGTATAGNFSYKTYNGIAVDMVDGTAGITASGPVNLVTTHATAGIGQNGAPIIALGGLDLVANGPVNLTAPANNVAKIDADLSGGSGSLSFKNSENLLIDGAVITNGNFIGIDVPATKTITVSGTVSSGTGVNAGIKLSGGGIVYGGGAVSNSEKISFSSTDPTQGITLSGGVLGTSNTQMIDLATDKLTLSGGTAMTGAAAGNGISITTFTANTPIVVGTGAVANTLYITDTGSATFNAPDFGIGSEIADTYNVLSGAIAVDAAISRPGGRVGLFTGAGVTQTAPIAAASLGVAAGGTVNLSNTSNQISNLAIETNAGDIDFANNTAFTITSMTGNVNDPLSITGVKSAGGGNITISSAGSIAIASPIVTGTGGSMVNLQSTAGSITDGIATGPSITANSLDISAYGGIGTLAAPLKTQISYLKATNSMGGDIAIVNTGALTTDAATAVTNSNSAGKISITAQSPLTIGAAGVSAGGDIMLTAGGPGWITDKTGDDLTINGPVTSSTGNIVLTAGNSISGSGLLVASNGVISQTANLNPSSVPLPPTLAQCTADPILSGCTAVLPTLATCTATPATAGCSAVLPTLAACTSDPAIAGCSAVLPSLATCISAPATAGCSVVLPTSAQCASDPSLAGCTAAPPVVQEQIVEPVAQVISATVTIIDAVTNDPLGAPLLTSVDAGQPLPEEQSASPQTFTDNNQAGTDEPQKTAEKEEDRKEEKKKDKNEDKTIEKTGAKNDDSAKKVYCN